MTDLVSGSQDRSIAGLVRQELGLKNIRKYFPNPSNPLDERGNTEAIEEFVNTSLWWLGEATPVELTDTFELDQNGMLQLDFGPAQRIKKIRRVFQGGRPYEEMRTDWSEGWALPRGHWYVRNRILYTLGYGEWRVLQKLYGYDPNAVLRPGPVDITYYGVPTEAQIEHNRRYTRACVDYALYLAFFSMVPRIVRAKNVKLEGIPQISDNATVYAQLADSYLKKAEAGVNVGSVTVTQR